MKYKYVRKKFEVNGIIEIPDNAVAIQNNGYVSLGTKDSEIRRFGIPGIKTETIWGLAIEWLEPVEIKPKSDYRGYYPEL